MCVNRALPASSYSKQSGMQKTTTMIKYYLLGSFLIPLFVYPKSDLNGEKLMGYLTAAEVKIELTPQLEERLREDGLKDGEEVHPSRFFMIAKSK